MERTEEQKLAQEPAMVKFGGKDYEIKPLPLIKATPWRRKFVALFSDVASLASVTTDTPDKFKGALDNILIDKPEEMANLFYEYTGLDKNEIEQIATSREFIKAFEEVVAFEAPFFGAAIRIATRLQRVTL